MRLDGPRWDADSPRRTNGSESEGRCRDGLGRGRRLIKIFRTTGPTLGDGAIQIHRGSAATTPTGAAALVSLVVVAMVASGDAGDGVEPTRLTSGGRVISVSIP